MIPLSKINLNNTTFVSTQLCVQVKLNILCRYTGRTPGHIHKILRMLEKPKSGSSLPPHLSSTAKKTDLFEINSGDKVNAVEIDNSKVSNISATLDKSLNYPVVDSNNVSDPTKASNTNIFSKVIYNKISNAARNSVSPHKSHILTENSPHVLQHKESLLRFMNYFASLQNEQINDPVFFLTYMKTLSDNTININRAFQLAVETVFRNKKIEEEIFKKVLLQNNTRFILQDVVGRNDGLVDVSTFYTYAQSKLIFENANYGPKLEVLVIVATCLKNLNDLSPKVKEFVSESKNRTGNTVCDLLIEGIHYDFKTTGDISYTKNNIYPFSFDNLTEGKVHMYLNSLLVNMRHKTLNKDVAFLYEKVNALLNEKSLSSFQKINIINAIILQDLPRHTFNMNLPIILPTTDKPFVPTFSNEEFKKLSIPTSKTLDPANILQSLIKFSEESWSTVIALNAFKETKGVLGKDENLTSYHNDQVD